MRVCACVDEQHLSLNTPFCGVPAQTDRWSLFPAEEDEYARYVHLKHSAANHHSPFAFSPSGSMRPSPESAAL